jgi:hypothetical protein
MCCRSESACHLRSNSPECPPTSAPHIPFWYSSVVTEN